MIDLVRGVIVMDGNEHRITKFEVMFRTPFGLCNTLAQALEACGEHQLPASMSIIPVVVARATDVMEAMS